MAEVSIHAPHEGERRVCNSAYRGVTWFQSTLPTRGSDFVESLMALGQSKFQSTLPTRGSDPRHNTQSRPPRGFNPRSPRGGATRHQHKLYISYRMFQSTLPTRGSD